MMGAASRFSGPIAVLLLAVAGALPADAETLRGPARVLDGDTLKIAGQTVRLRGVDAPERRQVCAAGGIEYRCGVTATAWMAEHTRDKAVRCAWRARDRYRRALAVCYVGRASVNAAVVRAGWALAYRRYSMAYVPDEDDARANRRGLWAGTFAPPWEWRKANRRRL
jgi:endonuclease YncB( thermonuclease family)